MLVWWSNSTQRERGPLTSAPCRALLYPSNTVSMRELMPSWNMQWEFRSWRSQVLSRLPVTAADVPPSWWKGRSIDTMFRWTGTRSQSAVTDTANVWSHDTTKFTSVSDGIQRPHPVQTVRWTCNSHTFICKVTCRQFQYLYIVCVCECVCVLN